jgi:uncharacterized protein YlxW (UPF0749 family)
VSVQSALNSLISTSLGTVYGIKEKTRLDAEKEKKEKEKAAKKTEGGTQELRNKLKEARGAAETLARDVENEREMRSQLEKRIEYLRSARGAVETLTGEGLISGRKAKEIIYKSDKGVNANGTALSPKS